jgi:hypothetical protein
MRRDLQRTLDAVDRRIDEKAGHSIMPGQAISVTTDGRFCRVRLQGSSRMVRASVMVGARIAPGDTVVGLRLPGTNLWTIIGAYNDGSRITDNALRLDAELAPPNKVVVTAGYGALVLIWDSPPQKVLTYQIEMADVGDEANPTTYTTSGSLFYYLCEPGTEKTFRLRAVTEDWRKSAWTDWATATAGGHLRYGVFEDRPLTPIGEYFATDTNELFIGDGTAWHTIAGGSGGGGSQVLWDADLPPVSPSTYDDEFETQLGAQWAEYDPGNLVGISWDSGAAKVLAVPEPYDYIAGKWIDLPAQEFTVVTKVRLVSTGKWSLPASSNAQRVSFGLVVSKLGSGDAPLLTGEIQLSRNAAANTTSRLAQAQLWSDDTTRTYGEYVYPAGSDIPQNGYEWYLRLRHSPNDAQAYYWRVDFSLDGITWNNGIAFRDTGFTTGAKVGFFACNRADSDLLEVHFEFWRYRATFDQPQAPCYGQSTAVISHSALNDLDADDHLQYHNDTRGDARYSPLSHTHVEADITDLDHDATALQGRSVAPAAPGNGEALVWSDANQQWEPGSVAGATVHQALFYFSGTVEVGASPLRIYNVTGQTQTISKVFVYGNGASGLIVDIHQDGTTIFTNQDHRPTLTGDTGYSTDIDVATWADGSYLECIIDAAAGSDVVVHVVYS